MKTVTVSVNPDFVKNFHKHGDSPVGLDEMFVSFDYVSELDAVEKRDEFGELLSLWFMNHNDMGAWMATQHEDMHDCIQVRC